MMVKHAHTCGFALEGCASVSKLVELAYAHAMEMATTTSWKDIFALRADNGLRARQVISCYYILLIFGFYMSKFNFR